MAKNWRIAYVSHYQASPISYWAHMPVKWPDEVKQSYKNTMNASEFDPPMPKPIPGKGWAVFYVTVDDIEYRFSSIDEINQFKEVFIQNPLPTTRRLCVDKQTGPNTHWLSRLPRKDKKHRDTVLRYLKSIERHYIDLF